MLFGFGVASEVIFSGYVFAFVGPERFQAISSLTQAAGLLGFLLAAEGGQLALAAGASLTSLFFASLTTVSAAAAISLALPVPRQAAGPTAGQEGDGLAMEALRPSEAEAEPGELRHTPAPAAAAPAAGGQPGWLPSAADLRLCYCTPELRLLGLWWVFGSLIGSYTENYGTNLFEVINPDVDGNGHVTFVTRSLCVAAAAAAVRACALGCKLEHNPQPNPRIQHPAGSVSTAGAIGEAAAAAGNAAVRGGCSCLCAAAGRDGWRHQPALRVLRLRLQHGGAAAAAVRAACAGRGCIGCRSLRRRRPGGQRAALLAAVRRQRGARPLRADAGAGGRRGSQPVDARAVCSPGCLRWANVSCRRGRCGCCWAWGCVGSGSQYRQGRWVCSHRRCSAG